MRYDTTQCNARDATRRDTQYQAGCCAVGAVPCPQLRSVHAVADAIAKLPSDGSSVDDADVLPLDGRRR